MRAVIQRVSSARVEVEDRVTGAIDQGLVILLGVGQGDTEQDALYLAEKTSRLRIFPDDADRMNLSLLDAQGEALVVSQFTLYGDCRKGRRPAFTAAADPEKAIKLYQKYCEDLTGQGITVQTGVFAADMHIHLVNDGPVTILLDSQKTF